MLCQFRADLLQARRDSSQLSQPEKQEVFAFLVNLLKGAGGNVINNDHRVRVELRILFPS